MSYYHVLVICYLSVDLPLIFLWSTDDHLATVEYWRTTWWLPGNFLLTLWILNIWWSLEDYLLIIRIFFDGHQDIIRWSSIHYLIIMCCIYLGCMLIIWWLLMTPWWLSVDNLIFMYWLSYVHLKQSLDYNQMIFRGSSYDHQKINTWSSDVTSVNYLKIIYDFIVIICWSPDYHAW